MPIYNVTDPTTGQSLKLTGDSAPTEQELSQIFAAQPPRQAENPIDRIFRQGEERRQKAAAEAASAPSMLGSFARGARESIGPGLGSLAGMAAGVALAPASGGLSMLIPLGGTIIGGTLGGLAQGVVDPMTAEREKALQRDMATNPVSSWVGSVAPMVAAMKPNISGIGTALRSMEGAATAAERAAISGARINMAAGGGIGGGLSLGMNALHGQLPTPGSFAGDVLLGAAFNEPNRLGRALGLHSSARPVMPGETAPAVTAQIEPGSTPVPIEAAAPVVAAEALTAPVSARPGYLGPEAPTGPIVMPPVVEGPTVGFQGVEGPNPASIFNPSEPVMPGAQAPENTAKPNGRQYQLKPREEASMPAPTEAPPVQTGTGEPLSPRDIELAKINSEYQTTVDKANSIKSLISRGRAQRSAEMFRNLRIKELNKKFPAPTEAPPVAGEAPPVPATSVEPIVSAPAETPKFTLPKELSQSSPKYGELPLTFESDLDRAAYILANDSVSGKKSRSADKFRKVITDAGLDEAAVIEHGKKVRDELKTKAKIARGYQEDSVYMPDQGFKIPSAAKPVAVEPIVNNESQANAKGQTNDQGQTNVQGQGETLLTPPEPPPVTGEAAPSEPLTTKPNATQERNQQESNLGEYQAGNEPRKTPKAGRRNRAVASGEKPQEVVIDNSIPKWEGEIPLAVSKKGITIKTEILVGNLENLRNRYNKKVANGEQVDPKDIRRISLLEAQIASRPKSIKSQAIDIVVKNPGEYPVIEAAIEAGMVAPPKGLAQIKKLRRNNARLKTKSIEKVTNADWDNHIPISEAPAGVAREVLKKVYGGDRNTGSPPSTVASNLGITVSEMWAKLGAELDSISKGGPTPIEERMYEYLTRYNSEDQAMNFGRLAMEPSPGKEATPVSALEEGDTMVIDGEEVKVVSTTENEDGSKTVSLRDGEKFGDQRVNSDSTNELYVDQTPDQFAQEQSAKAYEEATAAEMEQMAAEQAKLETKAAAPTKSEPYNPKTISSLRNQERVLVDKLWSMRNGNNGVRVTEQALLNTEKAIENVRANIEKYNQSNKPALPEEVVTPAAAAKPMSLEERINAIPEVEPKLPENATDFEKNLHNAMWAKERGLAKGAPLDPSKIAEIRSKSESPQEVKNFNNKSLFGLQEGGDAHMLKLQQEQTGDGAAITQAAEQAKANEAINNSLQRNIDFDKPVKPEFLQPAVDVVESQLDAIGRFLKSRVGASSLPIDIIGAETYKAVLLVLKASLKAGQTINKAIASAMATIKNTKITNEERKVIENELRSHAVKVAELAKGRDADIKIQIGLAAEAMKDATGIAGNRLGIMREVTKKFPDQADYIKKNLNRIMDEMVAQEDLISKSKSPSSKEWGAWGRERVAQLNEIYGDARSGLSANKAAKVARAIHDHIFTNMGKRAHDIADGMITGRTSKVGKAYADEHFLLRPGADGVNRVGADILQETDSTKFLNQLGRHLQDLQSSPDFVSIADAKKSGFLERVLEHVVDPSRDGELAKNPTLKKSVEFFSGIRGELLDYARKNNIEIGDLGPRSMRRAMDATKVFANREAFLKDAVKTYEAKFGAELRILAEKAKKAGPGSKEQKAFLKRTAEINAMDMNDLASRYLAGIEAGDLGITTDGNDFYLGEGGLTPNMFKAREFGPEAEVFLRKYMINDPFEMIKGEVVALARAVTKARLLGGMGKDGKFDSLGGWKKFRAELEAEGNLDMVPLYQQIIKNYLNVRGADSQAAQSLLQGIHGLTQLTYLARAAVSSLPEPTMVGVRAGSLREAARANMVTASNFVKLVRRAKPSESIIIAEALGEIKIGQHAMMGSESINNAFSGRGIFGNLVSKFHEKTFLTDLTNATMAASMDVGKTFINMNLKLIKENGALSRLSLQSLREIGIGREDLPMMQEFAARFKNEPNWSKLVLEDSPAAAKFRDALTLFKRTGGALDPTRASKTVASTNPITSLFYSLSGYLYEFHDKVSRRAFVRGKAAITGKMMIEGKMEPLTGTERAALLGEIAKGAVALYSTQYAVQLIRENLYADPERIAKDKRRTPGQIAKLRAAAALSRSSVFGPYDSIFNAITQARYQRDPATTILGAEIGGISDLFGQTANMIRGERNAPGTNTADRKLARSIYKMTVAPAVGALAATMPGYAVPSTLIQAAYHPAVSEAFVKGVAGPPVLPKMPTK